MFICGRKKEFQTNTNDANRVNQETMQSNTVETYENSNYPPHRPVEDPYIRPNSVKLTITESPASVNGIKKTSKNVRNHQSEYENEVAKSSNENNLYQNNTKDVNAFDNDHVYEKL